MLTLINIAGWNVKLKCWYNELPKTCWGLKDLIPYVLLRNAKKNIKEKRSPPVDYIGINKYIKIC